MPSFCVSKHINKNPTIIKIFSLKTSPFPGTYKERMTQRQNKNFSKLSKFGYIRFCNIGLTFLILQQTIKNFAVGLKESTDWNLKTEPDDLQVLPNLFLSCQSLVHCLSVGVWELTSTHLKPRLKPVMGTLFHLSEPQYLHVRLGGDDTAHSWCCTKSLR